MDIAEQSRFETIKAKSEGHDAPILLGYSFFVIVLLVAIYFGSMPSGITPGDLATITIFP
jgi:hypothetical protein